MSGSVTTYSRMAEYNRCHFRYFDIDQQEWKRIDAFKELGSGIASHALCILHDNLYLAGGFERRESYRARPALSEFDIIGHQEESDSDDDRWYMTNVPQRCFYLYNKKQNTWDRKESMKQARSRFCLVPLNFDIYAIGGLHQESAWNSDVSNVERYGHVGSGVYKWKYVAPLRPDESGTLYSSITAVMYRQTMYKETLLAYGMVNLSTATLIRPGVRGKFRHDLKVYHPKCSKYDAGHREGDYHPLCNTWQLALTEEHSGDEVFKRPPTLFVHQGVCYRIIHHIAPGTDGEHQRKSRPVVNVLKVEQENVGVHPVKVIVGEEVKQDFIPDNTAFAFRIHDEVFATEWESVFNTGIKIAADQSTNVDLTKLEALNKKKSVDNTSIIRFTFDKKFLK